MQVRDLLGEQRARLSFSDPFEKILRSFLKEEASILPVYQEETLVGVVRQVDVLSALNKGVAPGARQLLRDESYKYILADAPVTSIKKVMDYLLVINAHREKIGVLLPLDLARALPGAVQASRELNRELDAVINFSFDEIYTTDGQGITLRANAAFEENCGVKVKDILGRSVYELEKEKVFYPSATRIVFETKKQQTILQTQRSGKQILVTATPVFNEDGSIFRVITNSRNVDKLNQLREKLEELEKEKQRYYQELLELRQRVLLDEEIVVSSNVMQKLMAMSEKIAKVDSTVLLLGESGVGKGLIANLIHQLSPRKDGPFIHINCGAIPENLLESELFGYEGGAFTGASKEGKMGKIELATGGTVFLDEIGELPLNLQTKLLHIIQEKQMTRIGGIKVIKLDVRFLAATNLNLEEEVAKGKFRRDLFFRLNVLPIKIPPLRERQEDIVPLTEQILKKYNKKYNTLKRIQSDVLDHFLAYPWPGNIRELENLIERLVIVAEGIITVEDLPSGIKRFYRSGQTSRAMRATLSLTETLEEYERSLLQKVYDESQSTYQMAEKLGVNQSTVVRKLKKYHITKASPSPKEK